MPTLQRFHLWSALVCFGACSASILAQQQPPQFRTGIDLTRVEITVLHKDTRKPITGLTAEDFVIKVDGDAQRVATLAEVTVPRPAETSAPGLIEAAHDVARNDLTRPRLVVIVMNDAAGGNDPFDRQTGVRIAHRIVDGLGPEDKASIVFTRDNREAQDLTADRALLRRAIDRFRPMYTSGIVHLAILERAHQFLAKTPGYRRAVVFISPVWPYGSPEMPGAGAGRFGINEGLEATTREISAISASSRIGHVPIYLFSTHGLHATTAQDLRYGDGRNRDYEAHVDLFRTIGSLTGGRSITANNAPTEMVSSVFEELSSYYAVAYENTYPADGRRRWLQVQVKHPDAMVMPARVLITATKPAPEVKERAEFDPRRDSGLREALGAPLPAGEVPLRLTSVPLAVAKKREQAVALTLGLPRVPAGVSDQFTVRLMVFDGEGRREVLGQTHEVKIAGEPGAGDWNEMALRLDLRPGRYQMRIAAERASTNTAGSVHATVIIPDFERDALSLSGVAIGRAGGAPVGGREALADVLPFAPTVVRAFTNEDRIGALLRVHQSARQAAQPVLLDTEIIDAAGVVVQTGSRTIAAADFAAGGGVEHRFELPLGSLVPGEYLLRFAASAGEARAQRDVRFSVR